MSTLFLLLLLCLHGALSHADMTLSGLIVSAPKFDYAEKANPIGGVRVYFHINDHTLIATTDTLGHYEIRLPVVTGIDSRQVPSTGLFQNYPNPFNPSTVIPFSLSQPSDINLTVYNALGQRIRTLADGFHSSGRHSCVWDGRNSDGRAVAAGVYIYRLKTGDTALSSKMLLIDGGASPVVSARRADISPVSAKPSSTPNRCIMSIEKEGYLAWADTFTVYEHLQSRKNAILDQKGGHFDKNPDYPFFSINGYWADGDGSDSNGYTFDIGVENAKYISVITKEQGVINRVPWSYANVDSVYIMITESPKPERINLTIPMVFHFWTVMHPIVTNIDLLSDGILDKEIMALVHIVCKTSEQTETGGCHE
jgi:hypothetical protein